MRLQKRTLVLIAVMMLAQACASQAPPTLSPTGVKIWQANEAVVAIGTLQRTAIALNAVQVCDPAPCHPLFSDRNTRSVIDSVEVALKTIEKVPTGWAVTATTALEEIEKKLDAAGKTKLQAYITAARTVLAALTSGGVK